MTWRDLGWTNCSDGVPPARIEEVEEALGIGFPEDYRECVQQCHGGTPSKRHFRVPSPRMEFRSCLAVLLSLAPDNSENILQTCEMLADQLPPKLVPIEEDGGGDYVCLDYRDVGATGTPCVVYWHRSGLPDNELIPLAPSFSSFIELLN